MTVAGRRSSQAGFTLLEVLIAFAILAIAVVSLIQLTSQGMRLLKVSGDHQEAVQLADRIARETTVSPDKLEPDTASIETGEEGQFAWERRIERLPLPEEFERKPAAQGAAELPGLYAVSVAVHWGRNQSVQVATLRGPAPVAGAADTGDTGDQQGQTSDQDAQPGQRRPTQAGSGTQSGSGTPSSTSGRTQPGRTQTSPFGSRDGGKTSRSVDR